MRCRILRPVPALLVLLALVATAHAQKDEAATKTEFLKFVDDKSGGGKLETAIATYKNGDGVTVHLVGAVHIADQSYYDGLNQIFKDYDSVLYEMVKPKDAAPPRPGEERAGGSMISVIQRFMKDTLDLKFQLDAIDYTAPNFVHADLDAETFQKMEAERGESIWTLMLQQMLKQMADPPANQQEIGLGDLFAALTSPDRARQLKLIFGRQFGDIEAQMSGFGGTVLITERNKACFKVLDHEIADGKKNLGIFYGAGHMSDMEKRLIDRGFHKTDVEWRVGWDVSNDTEKKETKPKTKEDPTKGNKDNDIIKIEYVIQGR
ncbi:MAG TPA: hypothetical protein VIM11_08100 [Tepidisphaeraceae bacterium]|jgi:hypothetical protein